MAGIKKLRVISDGTRIGTQVVDAETGDDLSGYFRDVRIETSGGNPTMTLVATWVELDMMADGVNFEGTDLTYIERSDLPRQDASDA